MGSAIPKSFNSKTNKIKVDDIPMNSMRDSLKRPLYSV